MKILVVEPHALRPGPAMYAEQFCDALSAQGHNVTLLTAAGLITAGDKTHNWRHLTALPKNSRCVVGTVDSRGILFQRFATMLTQWLTGLAAFKMHRRHNYDAVHFLSSEPLTLSLVFFLLGSLDRIYVTNRGYEFGSQNALADLFTRSYQLARRLFWKTFARRITVFVESPYVRDVLQTDNIVRKKDICVVPHPAWSSKTVAASTQKDARKALGIDYDGKLFLIFGHRPVTQKAVDTIISAVAVLPRTFRVVIAGYEADKEVDPRLEQLICDARIEDRFYRHFRLIPNEEIERYFTACDAAILSYRKSYIGSSGILSLACEYGLPVIASDVADMGDTVRRYQIGVPFKPEDSESLADAILHFLAMPGDELLAMKQRMKSVNHERSWPNIARKHISIYAGRTPKSSINIPVPGRR